MRMIICGAGSDAEKMSMLNDLCVSMPTDISPPKQKRAKKVRDPLRPKAPMNGYMRWLSENRDSIKTELSALGECSLAKSVLKAAGGKWRELSEEEKAPHVSAYTSAKAEYTKAMLLYKPSSLPVEESVSSIITETLDGYEGPYKHKYLSRYASKDKYDSLSLAAEGALLLGNKCGGITLEVKGKYSLRKGCSLKDSGMKMEYSWMKSETSSADEAEVMSPTNDEATNGNEEKPKKHTLSKAKAKAKADADAEAKTKLAKAKTEAKTKAGCMEVEPEISEWYFNDQAKAKAEAKAKAKAEAKAKAKADAEAKAKADAKAKAEAEAKAEEDDGPELSDEEDTVELEEWTPRRDSVMYLVDDENIVYDRNTQSPVGKREGDELIVNKYM